MIILSLESTSHEVHCEIRYDSIMLYSNRIIASSFVADCPRLVHTALAEAKLQPRDVSLYSVVTGPGSWTGIRVGATLIRSMAFASRKPAVGVPLFPLLSAVFAPQEAAVAVMSPVRSSLLLAGMFDTTKAPPERIADIELVSDADPPTWLCRATRSLWLGGEFRPEWVARTGAPIVTTSMIPPGAVTAAAHEYLQAGMPSDPHRLISNYHISFPVMSKGSRAC
jgi:tRNA A37 threonylcarbamoyladenosine modification protein TsaB